jgi:hypothetical protein
MEYGIGFHEFRKNQSASGDILFVAGCGGYCKFWAGPMTWLQPYLKSFKKVYILPSTFDKSCKPVKDFLMNLPSTTEVYCRERISYKFVSEILGNRAHLSKDTAFYIPWEKYINQGHGILYAFRTDKESNHAVRIPKDNIDISLASKDFKDMLNIISSYKEVHTDRAHVAISASMLGKTTIVYDCGYFKVKAIYDYSLSELPNTKFIDTHLLNLHKLNWYFHNLGGHIRVRMSNVLRHALSHKIDRERIRP